MMAYTENNNTHIANACEGRCVSGGNIQSRDTGRFPVTAKGNSVKDRSA